MTRNPDQPGCDAPALSLHEVVEACRQHEQSVRRLCLRQLHSADAADDAAQETFLRASVLLRTTRPEAMGTYLHAIARNVCREELRRRRRGARRGADLMDPMPALDPEDMVMVRSFVDQVWRTLSARDRSLVILRLAGYSYDEIAQRLRLSATAVGVALSRARQRARRILDDVPALVAWWTRRWSRRRRGRRCRRPVALLRGAGWPATGKLVLALALLPALHAGPLLQHLVEVSSRTVDPLAAADPVAATGLEVTNPLAGVEVSSLLLSPSHGRGQTVYASGQRAGCTSACPVLERSGDGGHSWTALPARGFAGGPVLLAPAYPADPIILAASPEGLQRSDDGGRTFRTVASVAGPAAVAPGSAPGDALVAVASQRITLYHAGPGLVTPGPELPADIRASGVSFSADGRRLLVTTMDFGAGGQGRAGVLGCDLGGGCHGLPVAGEHTGSFRLLALPSAAGGGGVVVASSTRLYLVSPDGRAISLVRELATGELTELAASPGGPGGVRLLVALRQGAGAPSRLAGSTDLGRNLVAMGPPTIPAGTTALVAAPDGRILIAVSGADMVLGGSVRCSHDDGRTWQPRC